MRFWGKFKSDTKIVREHIVECVSSELLECVSYAIQEICNAADVSKPVLLSKHIHELKTFGRTVFYTLDFFDEKGFDEFELEIISSGKRR